VTIPILSTVIAPDTLWDAGSRGRVMRKNRRAQALGGHMQINVLWSNSLRRYEFGTMPLTLAVWRTLEALYEVTDAGASGFLVKDPHDCIVTVAYGKAIDYNLVGNIYQLVERITSPTGAVTNDRTITRLDAASFHVYVSGVETFTYTLDATTGRVTIPADPAAANVTWSGTTYVPVHFESDEIDWEIVVAGDEEEGGVHDGGAMWDPANHQSLCRPCHDAKTSEDLRRRRSRG
jgi:uncharacterized protein (TIGR02217 family)